jgi:ribosomal protein L24E
LVTVPFISVKKGTINYKSAVQPKRVGWTDDGKKQLPLDVNEFKNQYQ